MKAISQSLKVLLFLILMTPVFLTECARQKQSYSSSNEPVTTSESISAPNSTTSYDNLDPAVFVLPQPGETCLPRKRGQKTVTDITYPKSPECTTRHESVYYQVCCNFNGEMTYVQGSLAPDTLFINDQGELCGVSDKGFTNYCYRAGGWAVALEYCVETK